jgi:hypothetical protein
VLYVFHVWKADKKYYWFFFTPLGNVIFHTALAVFKWWQTGHNNVWHRKSMTQIIFSLGICQWQYEPMIAATVKRINLALPLHYNTAPWNCLWRSNLVAIVKNLITIVKKQHIQKWFCKSATLTCLCRKKILITHKHNTIKKEYTFPERYSSSIY